MNGMIHPKVNIDELAMPNALHSPFSFLCFFFSLGYAIASLTDPHHINYEE
ncbi:unnamed protein product [Sphenostylis stenocarpa]|uniref:Uncharacterized protein n=1 Tax=Sphenostylis stenocarpa TaxID=92480 RepID=A0AA86S5N2_9FABA|nr:unnamed protein product [Sphenostylis stenocarpa]